MYLTEPLILADQYEDKGFNTCSFRFKIKRVTMPNFYVATNTKTKNNYYGKLNKHYNMRCGYGNGYGNGCGYGFGSGNGTGYGTGYGFGHTIGNGCGNGFGSYNDNGNGKGIGDF